jgi:eukaryotic-like serine/threonine-protein kinase
LNLVSSNHGSQKRPPERLADRFRVLEEIGAGASAITYRGWDERLERPVAIKILRSGFAFDPTYVRRFQIEARAAASVSHGNVVDVYDFGQQDDALYIVMQFIDGEDLKHLIVREGALPADRVREIIGQVLDGLRAIHAAGIVHRDIKPQNVLIGRDGIARVTDFGVAQVAEDSGMTTAGTTVGTAAYMAPEQAQAGRISEATDLYAVGVMMYEMLTGFLPFNAPTAVAMMLLHIQDPPVAPSQRLPGRGIPRSLDGVVMQALAKNPADRFNSALAMKQAVQGRSQASYGNSQATVEMPAASSQSTTMMARPQPGPRPAMPPRTAPAAPPRSMEREGAGMRSALGGLFLVALLALGAMAVWYFYDDWRSNQGSDDPPTATVMVEAPVVTETVPATEEPTPAPTPEPTVPPTEEQPALIEPIDPTAAIEPTAEPSPTAEPLPTATTEPSPTPSPTDEPLPTPTEEPPLIEPIDPTQGASMLAQAPVDGAGAGAMVIPFAVIEEGVMASEKASRFDSVTVTVKGEQLRLSFVGQDDVVAEYVGTPGVKNGKLVLNDMEYISGDDDASTVKPKQLAKGIEDSVNDQIKAQHLEIDSVEVTGDALILETSET